MFSVRSRRMFSVGLQGKKEQKRERKRHFKHQMTHLMADIISPSDACLAPHLTFLTAAVETLHYSHGFHRSAPLAARLADFSA